MRFDNHVLLFIRAIQEALGHKSIAMTVRSSHLSPDFIQDALDRLAPPQEEEPAENRTLGGL